MPKLSSLGDPSGPGNRTFDFAMSFSCGTWPDLPTTYPVLPLVGLASAPYCNTCASGGSVGLINLNRPNTSIPAPPSAPTVPTTAPRNDRLPGYLAIKLNEINSSASTDMTAGKARRSGRTRRSIGPSIAVATITRSSSRSAKPIVASWNMLAANRIVMDKTDPAMF